MFFFFVFFFQAEDGIRDLTVTGVQTCALPISIWIVSDIDDRLRAQQALSQAHELLEQQVRDRTRELSATVENLHREIADRKLDQDRKSTRLNSSHSQISYAVFCLKKKKNKNTNQ